MKLKFTLEVFVCSNVRLSTGILWIFCFSFGKRFMLWMILFFWQAACLIFCFFLMFLAVCTHVSVCVCVSLYVHDPSSPGWMLCNHSSVRSLWGTIVGAFFLLPHPQSHLFSALLCHYIFKNASLFYLQRLNCFVFTTNSYTCQCFTCLFT